MSGESLLTMYLFLLMDHKAIFSLVAPVNDTRGRKEYFSYFRKDILNFTYYKDIGVCANTTTPPPLKKRK